MVFLCSIGDNWRVNVTSPEFLQNPYRFYAERRAATPVFRANEHTWTITGYEEMSALLARAAAGRGNIGQLPKPGGDTTVLDQTKQDNPALQVMDKWMLFKNPPEHIGMRKLVADLFTVKMINGLEQPMRETLDVLIDEIKRDNTDRSFDLVPTIAYQYPIRIICQMIGIPPEDWQRFYHWTRDFSVAVQVDFHRLPDAFRNRVNSSARELGHYFDTLVPLKKQQGGDDLMTRLIAAGGERLSHQDILANCVFLLFAGQETSTLLISNAVNTLLDHPDQYALLHEKPELVDNAVEEFLRYDPPIQMVGRLALEDIELAGNTLAAGDHIHAFLGAAGWDPAVNQDPDRFDITRDSIKHLAFARGAHHCLGATLARVEMTALLHAMLRHFKTLERAGPGVRKATWLMRGFDSLPVRYGS